MTDEQAASQIDYYSTFAEQSLRDLVQMWWNMRDEGVIEVYHLLRLPCAEAALMRMGVDLTVYPQFVSVSAKAAKASSDNHLRC